MAILINETTYIRATKTFLHLIISFVLYLK